MIEERRICALHSVKDVNFNEHLLHLFPKKLEYIFFWDTRYFLTSLYKVMPLFRSYIFIR